MVLRALLLLSAMLAASMLPCMAVEDEARISYNRDIRPILAENCFACHGPDQAQRKAGLALHQREMAIATVDSGAVAVVPGDATASELVVRIVTADEDDRMPPLKTGKHLSEAQITTLKKWIDQGAEWQPHWSYRAPQATLPPTPVEDHWSRNEVDRFLLTRLQREGLQPSPAADAVTLMRRLSFDLIGLPPGTDEQSRPDIAAYLAAYLAAPNDRTYERVVDQLLASPHFGERMAVGWLDLVRYADTIGYHSDNARNVSPYRDWVISAFNDDLPFDQFTIEQLAGDLLPNATLSQKVASTYNRLNLTTEEGGAQPKEYEAKSLADRVRNVSSVWLGSTMACCECHDHKFDPFSARDFYRMGAFFADIQEAPSGAREPGMAVPDAAHVVALAANSNDIQAIQRVLNTSTPSLTLAQDVWEKSLVGVIPPELGPWWSIGPYTATSPQLAFSTEYDPERTVNVAVPYADGKKWNQQTAWQDGQIISLLGDNSATYVYRAITAAAAGSLELSLGSDDTITVWVNGQRVLAHEVYRGVAPDQEKLIITLAPGVNTLLMKIVNGGGGYGFYFKALSEPSASIAAIISLPFAQRSAEQTAVLAAHFRTRTPLLEAERLQLAGYERRRTELEMGLRRTLATTAGPPRTVRIKRRGDWMDEGGEVVEPAVPHFLPQLVSQQRSTRLDLARWLVSRDQPLTARVTVNRLWQQVFGSGLSKSLEDFGIQGEWPVHPELLDWLAIDFMDHGWQVKRMMKMLVMSSAYRQSSQAGALAGRDPDNRLIARQSRFRLPAELVRDNALAISGLLVPTIGGDSVKPYQPAGYWRHLNFPAREWTASVGPDAYRRGLYTYWCRTFLQPSLLAFDASAREQCVAERARSDTPLQALALLNDPTYVEAARAFAEAILAHGGTTTATRFAWAYRRALTRSPSAEERAVLQALLERSMVTAKADPATRRVLTIGQRPLPANIDAIELVAWTAVARVILNLHETITRN